MISSGYENRKARIEMLPFIDVVFLLLVFFIYAMLSMVIHHGLQVDLSTASTTQISKKDYISISINKDNEVFVGDELINLDHLIKKIESQMGQNPTKPVFINSDKTADVGIAIRVLDLLKGAGIKTASFECDNIKS